MRISDWSSDVCSSDLVASIMSPRARLALAADLAMVVIFAAIGRAEHDRGNVVLGVLETAWPFLVGVLVGWLLVRLLGRREALDLGAGVTVVISAVVVGMLLRVVIGEGTALSFIIVATLVLGALLLGWRAISAWFAARSRNDAA